MSTITQSQVPRPRPFSRRRELVEWALVLAGYGLLTWLLIAHPVLTIVGGLGFGWFVLMIAGVLAPRPPVQPPAPPPAQITREEHQREVRHAALGGMLCGLILGCWFFDD